MALLNLHPPETSVAAAASASPDPTSARAISWSGFSLALPADWNLTLHRGDARRGAVAISNLHQTQLEIRWHTLSSRRVAAQMQHLVHRLQKRGAAVVECAPPVALATAGSLPAFNIQHSEFSLLLVPAPTRLYEFACPVNGSPLSSLLASFQDFSESSDWLWEVYGLKGLIPARCRLKKATLLPGRAQLDFTAFRQRRSLGSWSMADRLLGVQSLRQWAQAAIPFVRHHPTGVWTATPFGEQFALPRRHFIPPFRQSVTLTLEHVPARNLIRWQQVSGPVSLKMEP